MSEILLSNPVNKHHPLNRGRALWLYGVSPIDGGSKWHDLCDKTPGVLTSTNSTLPIWTSTPYGTGISMNLANNSTQYVDCGSQAGANIGSQDFSVAFWVFKRHNTSGFSDLWGVNRWFSGGHPGENEWSVEIGDGSGGNSNSCAFVVESGTTTYAARESSSLPTNTWCRIVAVKQGTTLTLYRNAQQIAQNASGPVSVNIVSARELQVGNSALNLFQPNAKFADVTLFIGRGLSASEVFADYELSQRGYPDVLNRVSPSTYFLAATTGGSVGTATGTSTATGVGQSIASSAGTSGGTSTATGVGASLVSGVGTASGTSTASGVGRSIVNVVGTASGSSTANAVGASLAAGSGTASGTSTATGVGASLVSGVGTASGTSTAIAVGASLAAGVGTANADSTASGVNSMLAIVTRVVSLVGAYAPMISVAGSYISDRSIEGIYAPTKEMNG